MLGSVRNSNRKSSALENTRGNNVSIVNLEEDVGQLILFAYSLDGLPDRERALAEVIAITIGTHGLEEVFCNLLSRNQTTLISQLISAIRDFGKYVVGREMPVAVTFGGKPIYKEEYERVYCNTKETN